MHIQQHVFFSEKSNASIFESYVFPLFKGPKGSHYIDSHCKKISSIVPKWSVPKLTVSIFVVPKLTYYLSIY